tara:strand:+ start:528 stop:812 length:285 start_codon:yes stop_codon:yes gene_type:complete
MTIETFPEDVQFQVVADATNIFFAERGDESLICITSDGEKIKVDLFTGGNFPVEVKPIDLIGRHFIAGHFSTVEYFANDLTEIHPNEIPTIRKS